MSGRSMKEDDPLEDFALRETTLDGVTKRVYVAGSGPAVIVMSEMPGISPHVARFARWVRDAGFTVYMPSLFGRDGAVPGAEEGAVVSRRACVSAEFRAFAANQSSPVTQWLWALARLAHRQCGGPAVGAVDCAAEDPVAGGVRGVEGSAAGRARARLRVGGRDLREGRAGEGQGRDARLDAPELLREVAEGVAYVDGARESGATRRPPPDLVYTLLDETSMVLRLRVWKRSLPTADRL